jgi:hypothetical protein
MSLYKILTSAAVLWIALPAPVGAAIQEARVSGGTFMGTIDNGVASYKGIHLPHRRLGSCVGNRRSLSFPGTESREVTPSDCRVHRSLEMKFRGQRIASF